MLFSAVDPELGRAFPKGATALRWDCLKDLESEEIGLEKVEEFSLGATG